MEVTEQKFGSTVVVALNGRLDATASSAFGLRAGRVLELRPREVVLDLECLEYISSAGFRALLVFGQQVTQIGGALHLCALSAKVEVLFDIGGFDGLFPTHPSRTIALDLLQGGMAGRAGA